MKGKRTMATVTITLQDDPSDPQKGQIVLSSDPPFSVPDDFEGMSPEDVFEYIVQNGATQSQLAALSMLIDLTGTVALLEMIFLDIGSQN